MGVTFAAETAPANPDDPWRGDRSGEQAATQPVARGEASHRPLPGDPLTPDMISAMGEDDANVMKQGLDAYHAGNKVGAFSSWQREADKGIAEAQARVALLYARGEGTKQDAIEAYRWLRLAATQGNASAWVELPLVAAQLSPAERAMGESLVRTPNGAQNKPR